MNHSSRKRGEVKTEAQVKKEREFSQRVSKALGNFFKVRNNWKNCGKTLDQLLDYSAKLLALLSEHPTVFNFREDLIEAKVNECLKRLMEIKMKEKAKAEEAQMEETQVGEEAQVEETEQGEGEAEQESGQEEAQEQDKQPEEPKEEPEKKEEKSPLEELIGLFKQEMMFLVQLAMKDPKCYQIWFHRKWILRKIHKIETTLGQDGTITKKFFEGDLKICDKFLAKDERNFHAWNYRCFLVYFLVEKFPDDALRVVERELGFLKKKLQSNFSNYSAIHFLSKYLVLKEKLISGVDDDDMVILSPDILQQELKFLTDGLFIAPFEQSLWIYQDWILNFYRIYKIVSMAVDGDCVVIQFNRKIREGMFELKSGDDQDITPVYQNQSIRVPVEAVGGTSWTLSLADGGKARDLMNNYSISVTNGTASNEEAEDQEGSILERMSKFWAESVENVRKILETEPDKKEVVLNFCTLESEFVLMNEGLESFLQKKATWKNMIDDLGQKLDGANPIVGAIWDKIDDRHFEILNMA